MDDRDQLFTDVLDAVIDGPLTGRGALGAFMRLSQVLVGPASLAEWTGRAYLGTLLDGASKLGDQQTPEYYRTDIRSVLERFHQLEQVYIGQPAQLARQVQTQLLLSQEPGIANVTKSIAALWYCAGLIELTDMGYMTRAAPKETYAMALAWQAVGGNPMGIPGPYYGNWSYPSPTLIEPPQPEAAAEQDSPSQQATAMAVAS